jgi:hypothetical protein
MSHSHHHHTHSHAHGPERGPARRAPSLSLLRIGVFARLGAAAVVAALLWLAILWALI